MARTERSRCTPTRTARAARSGLPRRLRRRSVDASGLVASSRCHGAGLFLLSSNGGCGALKPLLGEYD